MIMFRVENRDHVKNHVQKQPPHRSAWCPTLVAGAAAALLCATSAQAFETRYVHDNAGRPLFELNFYDQGERYQEYSYDTDPGYSPWQLSEDQKQAVMESFRLWTEILSPGSNIKNPVPITVGTYCDPNAQATAEFSSDEGSIVGSDTAHAVIEGLESTQPTVIQLGTLDFATPGLLSPLPETDKVDLTAVIYHEFAHSLGIYSNGMLNESQSVITVWDSHLRDANGTWLRPEVTVVSADDPRAGTADDVFVVGDETSSGVTFHGEHVAEVLGSDEGLLVEGLEGDYADLSHIELEHGLMSHQTYRNYTVLMEAEIAALQDLGYDIDRRNFFGFSVYGDNLTIVNDNGFFARNTSRDGYLEGEENLSTLGVGLHIYGKHNTVTQAADLLACGTAGTGIRIDGSSNRLIINPDVRIAANGLGGTGLLVAYGKEHSIVSRGTMEALGPQGIAARFDFGNNMLGNDTEYRGSWIWTYGTDGVHHNPILDANGNPYYDYSGLPLNLNGALVKQFDVSGTLAGSAAAICIASNAWVKNINVLTGASITGNIISLWDPEDTRIQYPGDKSDLHTQLTFGLAPKADGSASTNPDASFDMTLAGAIDGAASIDMTLAAGRLAVTGPVNVHSLTNNGHLALLGENSQGWSAQSATTFVNGAEATLETGFHADGAVAGVKAQSATLAGTWLLTPLSEFYASGATIKVDAPVKAEQIDGRFESIALAEIQSPTLSFTLASEADGQSLQRTETAGAAVTVNRAANAYSRWAADGAAAQVGAALDAIAARAEGDMQQLVSALDWSNASGADIRTALDQLGPQAYDMAAQASLTEHAQMNAMLKERLLMQKDGAPRLLNEAGDARGWQVWAAPFGISTQGDLVGTRAASKSTGGGLIAGVDHALDEGGTVGFHAALMSRRTTMSKAYDAEAETFSAYVGVHGAMAPADWNGVYLTALARVGFEDGEMKRSTVVNGYARRSESHWTGFSGSVLLGAGKDWNFKVADGQLALGPVAWLEYSLLRRPGMTETGGAAADLSVRSQTYDALAWSLGGHAKMKTVRDNGDAVGLGVLAAWRHDVLGGNLHTRAAFAGYGDYGFESSTNPGGRDAMLVEASIELAQANGFRLQFNGGGELFRRDAAAASFGLSLGWSF